VKRWSTVLLFLFSLMGTLIFSAPAESICWGSLSVLSRSTLARNRCPYPTLTRTWRVRCYTGCGHTDGTFDRSLTGYGECFQGKYCNSGIRCLPAAGSDIHRFNPPSLTSTMINREGYYALPCNLAGCRTSGISTMIVECNCDPFGGPRSCADNDPIVVSLGDQRYQLTDRQGGVEFDLGESGLAAAVPWTDPAGDEAFLVLDRNENGTIDNGAELFGDVTPQHSSDEPNGFLALALFDDVLSGGNEDGRISAADEIFTRLQLWRDTNHNGVSEQGELVTLEQVGLEWFDLEFKASQRVDRHGNRFRFKASSGWLGNGTRLVWNVFLVAQ
jgi:hypothetical protein